MSMLPGGGAEPPTRDDLRRLEARLDARLQEVNARVVLHDSRFAAMGDRIDQVDHRCDALAIRMESRLRTMDRRFDAIDRRFDSTDRHLDKIHDTTDTHLRRARRELIVGLAGSTATTATLCVGSFLVLI